MKLYLHIGTRKTGTTTIQEFLYRNRSALASQGYLYPVSVLDELPAQYNHNPLVVRQPALLQRQLRAELQEAALPATILSADALQRMLPDSGHVQQLRVFLESLGFAEIVIVVYLREPSALFVSLCSQSVLAGRNVPFTYQSPPHHPVFKFEADHRATLQRWGGVFGYDRLRVRLFEREAFHKGDLLEDFLQAIDLRWQENFTRPAPQNTSLNLLEMELLYALNRLVPDKACYAADNLKYLLLPILRQNLRLDSPDLRLVPPPAIIEAWRTYFAAGNEWVRSQFFPERQTLFTLRPLADYPAHTTLTHLTPGAWEGLARTYLVLAQNLAQARRELAALRAAAQPSPAPPAPPAQP